MEFFMGLLILLLYRIYDRKTIRIEWNRVTAFMSFMMVVTMVRISGFSLLLEFVPGFTVPELPFELIQMGMWQIMLVFWEDAFYALPICFAFARLKKWIAIPIAVCFSMLFGMAHLYQGLFWAAATLVYPYFISYRYGKRYGFGTVMVCHIFYDFVTIYTLYYIPYLLL